MKRIALAFLIAPFPAAFIESVVVGVWPKVGKGVFEHPASMFVLLCLLFYFVELVFALPLYIVMRKRLPRRAFSYGMAGGLMVLLPIIVGLGLGAAKGQLSTYVVLYNFVFFAVGGFLAGLVFWWVAKLRTEPVIS